MLAGLSASGASLRRARGGAPPPWGRSQNSPRVWPWIVVGCLALAAISLVVLPRGLAYDPWSWVIWGREIAHLDLNTRGAATAVKPLPMVFTTIFAPAGSAAPVLWLLVARAATLLSLALAFRLGQRLGGAGAGVIAAVGFGGDRPVRLVSVHRGDVRADGSRGDPGRS